MHEDVNTRADAGQRPVRLSVPALVLLGFVAYLAGIFIAWIWGG